VWVGVIALVGLAAQTGIVMIVYIDHAYERRKAAGKIRDLDDIIWAHMEGTVLRVRPKLMTVATMLAGLIPLLWATGSGADVMKRIAVPMIGGLITSAFLTLEIIPVIYTYWRQEQLLWERLGPLDRMRLEALETATWVQGAGWIILALTLVVPIYTSVPSSTHRTFVVLGAVAALGGLVAYLVLRPRARSLVFEQKG
jgi:Cu(I)/Ag(I) efflux system membrane protein CusA/SilA